MGKRLWWEKGKVERSKGERGKGGRGEEKGKDKKGGEGGMGVCALGEEECEEKGEMSKRKEEGKKV